MVNFCGCAAFTVLYNPANLSVSVGKFVLLGCHCFWDTVVHFFWGCDSLFCMGLIIFVNLICSEVRSIASSHPVVYRVTHLIKPFPISSRTPPAEKSILISQIWQSLSSIIIWAPIIGALGIALLFLLRRWLLIDKSIVSLIDFNKFFLVSRHLLRMVLQCQLSVSLLNLFLSGISGNFEDLMIIFFLPRVMFLEEFLLLFIIEVIFLEKFVEGIIGIL